MKKYALLFIIFCSLPFSQPVFAQDLEDSWFTWNDSLQFAWQRSPTVSVFYGFTNNNLNNLHGTLASNNIAEFRIGGSYLNPSKRAPEILRYKHDFISLSNISYNIGKDAAAGELSADIWRLLFANESGYGYRFSGECTSPSIILTHTSGIQWTRIKTKDLGLLTDPADANRLSLYENALRFGNTFAAGIKIRITPLLSVDAGYERSITYQRHMFWKWAGSSLIEEALQWSVDGFVKEILKSTPAAVPIVSFVLKNGLSWGMYQLRKEKMNWPFDSEAPFLNDSFKVGLTFTF